ncbi:hypothetical protein PMAYCL1PPCAC_27448, partial [Pristionchus mayeri]
TSSASPFTAECSPPSSLVNLLKTFRIGELKSFKRNKFAFLSKRRDIKDGGHDSVIDPPAGDLEISDGRTAQKLSAHRKILRIELYHI